MTLRPAENIGTTVIHRPSVRVAQAAAILDVDIYRVYRMAKAGELEAHYIGARGIRIFADSIRSYQENQRVKPIFNHAQKPQTRPERSNWRAPAHYEAMAYLQAEGVL